MPPNPRRLAALSLTLLIPATPAAQAPAHQPGAAVAGAGQLPAGWRLRADEEGTGPARIKMELMAPGWHLTMGSAAILYRPTDVGRGAYQVQSVMHLFPGQGSRTEAYGLFIGGRDLDAATQRYTYFLIRGDGKFKIKRRSGAATQDVTAWQASPAIRRADPQHPVQNVLRIVVGGGRVRFLVNDRELYSAPASALDTEGIAGLRVNHNLSLHIETLTVGG